MSNSKYSNGFDVHAFILQATSPQELDSIDYLTSRKGESEETKNAKKDKKCQRGRDDSGEFPVQHASKKKERMLVDKNV